MDMALFYGRPKPVSNDKLLVSTLFGNKLIPDGLAQCQLGKLARFDGAANDEKMGRSDLNPNMEQKVFG